MINVLIIIGIICLAIEIIRMFVSAIYMIFTSNGPLKSLQMRTFNLIEIAFVTFGFVILLLNYINS